MKEDKVFYCQLDSFFAQKDYLQSGRCVRMIAIEEKNWAQNLFEEEITTFVLDLDYWDFSFLLFRNKKISLKDDKLQFMEHLARDVWYKITIRPGNGRSYFYAAFSEDSPIYAKMISLKMVSGPAVPADKLDEYDDLYVDLRRKDSPEFVFESFHVGQGMCSLVHNGIVGVLLDAGAGTPIKRPCYISKRKPLHNELSCRIKDLEELHIIVSHPDNDHVNLLAWDSMLHCKINRIYAPSGAPSLLLKDRFVAKKVRAINDRIFRLHEKTSIRTYRSQPSSSDSNGDCLVTIFRKKNERVLASGDYVYHRFLSDGNPGVAGLGKMLYSAVVVPHHGDEASARDVVDPKDKAIAFFSAGDNKNCDHPRDSSLKAHGSKGFEVVHDNRLNIVKACKLL